MGVFTPTLPEAVMWLRESREMDPDMDVAAVQKVRKAAADFGDRSWDLREAARHFGVDVDVIGGMLEVLLTEGFEEFFVGRFGDSVFTIGRIPNESHEEF